jgi:hypothetical protein
MRKLSPADADNYVLDIQQLFDGIKKGQGALFPDLNHSHTELGQVNGQSFVRARLTGTSATKGPAHGFLYVSHFGHNAVGWFSEELDAHQDNLRLLEASALSMRIPQG